MHFYPKEILLETTINSYKMLYNLILCRYLRGNTITIIIHDVSINRYNIKFNKSCVLIEHEFERTWK